MRLIPITAQQAQSYSIGQGAPQAALQQPGAQLQQTQQSTQTSAAESANLQAQNPGVQAESGIKQVQQQQVNYPLNLKSDLDRGMTLKSAVNKYSSLMKSDDIFRQYLSESPYGMPHETPTQLQNMGISPEALGKIGDPSSFMDRWNTKNALTELRGLKDTWDQTDSISHLPFLGAGDSSARAYNAQKQVVGEHLSSLVPGASNSQGSNQGFLDTLPSAGDPFAPGAAEGQFNKIEQALLQSKGYTYQDLGLAAPKTKTSKSPSGGDMLTKLISNGVSDAGNIAKSTLLNSAAPFMGPLAFLSPEMAHTVYRDPVGAILGTGNELSQASGVGQNGKIIDTNEAKQHFMDHPVNTAADVLAVLGLAGGATDAITGGAGGETTAAAEIPKAEPGLPNVKGNPVMNMLNPKGQISRGGAFRDTVVGAADKTGAVVSGDNLASSIRAWADQAKLSNLPDADAIENAAKTAETQYAGKVFKPSELQNIYDNIEKGYTKGGEPRSATASYIDRGIKNVLADKLNGVTNNQWGTGTTEMAKGYAGQKSPVRKVAGRAASVGLGIAGLDEVRHLLGL